jgi:hypothetical protein
MTSCRSRPFGDLVVPGPGWLDERARAVGIQEVLRKPVQSKDIAECFGRVLPRALRP